MPRFFHKLNNYIEITKENRVRNTVFRFLVEVRGFVATKERNS